MRLYSTNYMYSFYLQTVIFKQKKCLYSMNFWYYLRNRKFMSSRHPLSVNQNVYIWFSEVLGLSTIIFYPIMYYTDTYTAVFRWVFNLTKQWFSALKSYVCPEISGSGQNIFSRISTYLLCYEEEQTTQLSVCKLLAFLTWELLLLWAAFMTSWFVILRVTLVYYKY